MAPLRIQLWSCNYEPEPTGIAPVSATLARALRDRGFAVEVVAAHPHYPEAKWGMRAHPYREQRDGIDVLRLPLWSGRATAAQRYRQELTFTAALSLVAAVLPRPDVGIVVSPSFPALAPAIARARMRRYPWVLWLQDILPDGAASSGLVDEEGAVVRVSRRLELAAYRSASRIAVISHGFVDNLAQKGVPGEKVDLIHNPTTRRPKSPPAVGSIGDRGPLKILSMGNIGHSQGLAGVVRSFEASNALDGVDVKLTILGTGVAEGDLRREIRTNRVEMPGLVSDAELDRQLATTTIGLVTQHYEGGEFNTPSKLMNFMAYGLPVLAVVDPRSETAKIVGESGGGWVVDNRDRDLFPRKLREIAMAGDELPAISAASRAYAERNFSEDRFGAKFAKTLLLARGSQAGTRASI